MCAAPTGAANQALYGKMPSVVYQDYPEATLIILWGVQPVGVRASISSRTSARRRSAARSSWSSIRARTPLARAADLHLAVKPGTDLAVALAVHRYLFENGHADQAFLDAHTTGADRLRERACEWTFERAAEVAGVEPRTLAAVRATLRADVSRRSSAAAGGSSATATAATRRWRSWRCRRSAASSASAAAATR